MGGVLEQLGKWGRPGHPGMNRQGDPPGRQALFEDSEAAGIEADLVAEGSWDSILDVL